MTDPSILDALHGDVAGHAGKARARERVGAAQPFAIHRHVDAQKLAGLKLDGGSIRFGDVDRNCILCLAHHPRDLERPCHVWRLPRQRHDRAGSRTGALDQRGGRLAEDQPISQHSCVASRCAKLVCEPSWQKAERVDLVEGNRRRSFGHDRCRRFATRSVEHHPRVEPRLVDVRAERTRKRACRERGSGIESARSAAMSALHDVQPAEGIGKCQV